MRNGFTKGLLVGGIIATGMISVMGARGNKRKLLKNSRHLMVRAGKLADDIVDMFK